MASENYVGKLNQYEQKHRVPLRIDYLGSDGPDHNKTFRWRVTLDGKTYPIGEGKTKMEAKQDAAEKAWKRLSKGDDQDSVDSDQNATAASARVHQDSLNYICCLNQYGQTNGVNISLEETTRRERNETTYNSSRSLSLNSSDSGLKEINYIGLVNHYCQKTGIEYDYINVGRSGPPHNPRFVYKMKINNKEYDVAEGTSKKDAQQKAARLAWSALQEQSDWDSKVSLRSVESEDDGPSESSGPSTTLDSSEASSHNVSSNASNSIIFEESSNHSNAQDIMPNFKRDNDENIDREKSSANSGASRFISEFDSIEHLGHGAFGKVFKAKQKLLENDFAIKIVHCKEKALREVKALLALQHPNIVRYYTCWLEDCDYQWESSSGSFSSSQSSSEYSGKYLYIQMELCDARTLRVWIDEKNTQNMETSLRDSRRRNESLTFALQIVSGVEYIHSKMLFHRDLKPANIMLGQDGKMKIGDFGLVAESYDSDNLVERSMYRGTPSYMAPEQKEKKTYDRKVDIFALGLIYFEMLWNISGHERVLIWGDVRNQNLPKEFCQHFGQETLVIKSLLRVNPEERPEASQLKADLEKFIQASEAREQRTC